ncbi:GD15991 [Drosophila simulans]|uniref:GD15991 n=1 Tax=Drosophila simulans TaxID=7240 RepID=B4R2T8_DROSI|nr:GD15991 [Drosophila simulans]
MRVGKLCRLALRFWMGLVVVLGFSSHYYSPTRRRLVHSRILQTYDWLLMVINLVAFYAYYRYAMTYFLEGMFRRQGFVNQVSTCNVFQQLLMAVTSTLLHLLFERQVCQTYNEVSTILEQDLQLKEHSRFYCLAFLAKFYNFLHNFNFALIFPFSLLYVHFPSGQFSYNEQQQQRTGNGNGRRLAHKSEKAERLKRLK